MSAKKLFQILMGGLAYLLVPLLWFAYAAPGMIEHGTDATLITASFGSMTWLAVTGCIVIYIIQKTRP